MPRCAFIPIHSANLQLQSSFRQSTCLGHHSKPTTRLRITPTAIQTSRPPLRNLIPTTAYIVYMTHLFIAQPTGSLTPIISLIEAAKLSLNFIYIVPLVLPSIAPDLHPMLEAIFNVVVAWSLLLLAFVSEDVPNRSKIPAPPFLIGAAFLTNILYLPYISLHTPNTTSLQSIPISLKSRLLTFAESRALPLISLSMALTSIPWALLARPSYGPFSVRLTSFLSILDSDILAHSFAVDMLVFSIFQAWLVRTDAARRIWKQTTQHPSVQAATFIPFFGLAWYIWTRANQAPILWSHDDDAS